MISVREAKIKIFENIPPLKSESLILENSLGYFLAQDVKAPIALPIQDNSAMDGFTLRSKDAEAASSAHPVRLKICAILQAGKESKKKLKQGEAFRIMTGAFIPKGADAVLPKEEAIIQGDRLIIERPLKAGNHVRFRGEEMKRGTLVLKKHSAINPGTMALLASLGLSPVRTFRKPVVSVITTGSELIRPGRPLTSGKIYDSNSIMLSSLLVSMGISPERVKTVTDQEKVLNKTVEQALAESDVLILTGGVSVGDYDFVREVLAKKGVRSVFWKVSQKPGKPIFFGKKGRTLVFGLPGNPAAVFTCFYEYVYPALRKMSGCLEDALVRKQRIIQTDVDQDSMRSLFLKAKILNGGGVIPLSHQGSHMVSSLHEMDCLIFIPPGQGTFKKGEQVDVDLLPGKGGTG